LHRAITRSRPRRTYATIGERDDSGSTHMTCNRRLIIVFGSLWLLAAAAGVLAGETLSATEARKLNTFFSNFSEARMATCTPGSGGERWILTQYAVIDGAP